MEREGYKSRKGTPNLIFILTKRRENKRDSFDAVNLETSRSRGNRAGQMTIKSKSSTETFKQNFLVSIHMSNGLMGNSF